MGYISKYGVFGTVKRVRVRKTEKKPKKIRHSRKSRSKSRSGFYNVQNSSRSDTGRSSDYRFEGTRIKTEEDREVHTSGTRDAPDIEEKKAINPNLVSFDHNITDFEVKLRYLNLKDTMGKEYGRFFPPIRSRFVIMDEEGREFSVIRAGNNQISGDVIRFLSSNDLKPGDLVSVEYDRDERSNQGLHIIRFKIKK